MNWIRKKIAEWFLALFVNEATKLADGKAGADSNTIRGAANALVAAVVALGAWVLQAHPSTQMVIDRVAHLPQWADLLVAVLASVWTMAELAISQIGHRAAQGKIIAGLAKK